VERISLEEARTNIEDVLQLVGRARQRFVVHVGGRDVAAFVSLEDLALLERLDGDREVAKEYVDAKHLGRHLDDEVALVEDDRERIVIREDRDDFVALVPARDLQALESLDARLDLEAAKRILQNLGRMQQQRPARRDDDPDDDE
jgi:PHD/YefM family antitoxin component YafN of YafNO toxin-antitoxin module